jgi:hypothetical protein
MLERGRCESRPTAPLHSRSVRCDELNFQLSTPTFGSTTKLQHIPLGFRFPTSITVGRLKGRFELEAY